VKILAIKGGLITIRVPKNEKKHVHISNNTSLSPIIITPLSRTHIGDKYNMLFISDKDIRDTAYTKKMWLIDPYILSNILLFYLFFYFYFYL
jgi:hypothetical protein